MGLLDSLTSGSQGGYGGLLDMLMYPSQQPQAAQQPQYDPMGNYTGVTPQNAPDPFGPPPQMGQWAQQFQPPSPVTATAPATPIQFAAGPTMQPQAPAPPQAAPAPQPAQAPQDSPINNMNIGGYQMPQFGNAADYTPQPTQAAQAPQGMPTDVSAQSRQPQALPPAFGNPDEGRFTAGLRNLGNPGGIINKLVDSAQGFSTGQRTDPQGMQQANLRAQYQAFVGAGLSPQNAMLAVMNPEAGKTLINEALTNKQEFKTMKDALGGEHGYWIDKNNQTMTPAEGKGAGGAPIGGGTAVLAKGVSQYNPELSGDTYMAQFSPEVQNAAKAYINGDVQPTGNPRNQGIETLAKKVAQKYGADTGVPVSDTLFAEKRKYRIELGTNSPNSAGGQAKAFNQGISHMTSLAENLEKLDNSNGLGIPVIANATNAIRQGVSTQQSAISDEAKSLGQTVAGEVGKLFSGSAGGGVHEREMTRERFDTIKSKPQMAAALRATIETMQGGLQALEQRRDSILGPNSGVELVSEQTRQNIAKIQGVIDRLEGKAPHGTATTGGIPSGWSVKVR